MGAPLVKGFEILFSRHWVDDYSTLSREHGASYCDVVRLQNLGCSVQQIDTYLVLFYFFIHIHFNNRATFDKAREAVARSDFEAEVPRQGTV